MLYVHGLVLAGVVVVVSAQVNIEIRQYEWVLGSSNFTVLADYAFPSGFTLDVFKTTYSNVPPGGITGTLCHPNPPSGCSMLNASNCCTELNVSRIAILDDYHLCTQQKINSIQTASFDALILYSTGSGVPDLGEERLQTHRIPLVLVTEQFAEVLLEVGIPAEDCSMGILVVISKGSNVVYSAFIAFLAILTLGIVLVLLFCVLLVLCCVRRCHRKRGQYNVHEIQMQLEEFEEHRLQYVGTQVIPYSPTQQEFRCEGDAGGGSEDAQCPICLEEFGEGEMVSVLGCDGGHTFHPACIQKWLDSQGVCPVCRTFMKPTIVN